MAAQEAIERQRSASHRSPVTYRAKWWLAAGLLSGSDIGESIGAANRIRLL